MKVEKRRWIVLIVAWMSYFVWEYLGQQWSQNEETAVIRVDLIIIIPLLIIISSVVLFKNLKK